MEIKKEIEHELRTIDEKLKHEVIEIKPKKIFKI